MQIKTWLASIVGLVAIAPIAIATNQQPNQDLQLKGDRLSNSPSVLQQPVHPDEPIQSTLNQRFSVGNSLGRVAQVQSALNSFKQLTQTSQTQLDETTLSQVGNTDWETQNLGFYNWMGDIEGTLREQDLEIKRLQLDLAQKQFADGEITQAELDQHTAAYETASQSFQSFWRNFRIAD